MATATLLATLVTIGAQPDAGEASAKAKATRVTHCVVKVIDEVKVPAREAGALVTIIVREGQAVKKDAAVAQLDDHDAAARLKIAEAEYRVAEAQADSDIRVRAARAEAEVTETEFLRGGSPIGGNNQDAEQRRLKRLLLSPRQAQLKTSVAQLDYEIAKLNLGVRATELKAAEQRLDRRRVLAPHDGVVVQIYRNVGEWVNSGDPIMHVVRMDRLRIDGLISAAQFAPEEVIGKSVEIIVNLSRGRVAKLRSKISFASPIVESNGRFRVSAEVDNRKQGEFWQLRPGLTAEMTIAFGE